MKRFDIVKYANPTNQEESSYRFLLLDDPKETDRLAIQYICDYPIKPIERVHASELVKA